MSKKHRNTSQLIHQIGDRTAVVLDGQTVAVTLRRAIHANGISETWKVELPGGECEEIQIERGGLWEL